MKKHMKKLFDRIIGKLNALTRATFWYREIVWGGSAKYWTFNTFGLQVLNAGSNTGRYSFDYSVLPFKGFNFALGPQSLVHDFNIIKNYFSYFANGAVVVITLCPFSCLVSKYGKESRFKYYPILHPATIDGFDEKERTQAFEMRDNPFRTLPFSCFKAIVKERMERVVYRLKGVLFGRITRIFSRQKSYDEVMEDSAFRFVNGWKTQFGIENLLAPVSEKHRAEMELRASTLREMVLFCKERGFCPVFVLPPMHKSLRKRLPDTVLKKYVYDFVKVAQCEDVPFFNYVDEEFSDCCFSNALFLNDFGAKRFTVRFVFDLVRLGIGCFRDLKNNIK